MEVMDVATIEAKEAKHGEKMIEIKVRLWTNDIANEPDKILPKHAWGFGVVRMERNESHGISPNSPVPFQSLMDLNSVIEQVLIDHGITLRPSPKMKKYVKDDL